MLRNEHDGDEMTAVCPVCRHTFEADRCGWVRRLPAHDRTGAVTDVPRAARCPGSGTRPAPTARETLRQVGRDHLARAVRLLDEAAELYPADRDMLADVAAAVREAWVKGVAVEELWPAHRERGERADADDAAVWLGSDPAPHVMVTAAPGFGKTGRVRRVLKPDAVVEVTDGKAAWHALFPDRLARPTDDGDEGSA